MMKRTSEFFIHLTSNSSNHYVGRRGVWCRPRPELRSTEVKVQVHKLMMRNRQGDHQSVGIHYTQRPYHPPPGLQSMRNVLSVDLISLIKVSTVLVKDHMYLQNKYNEKYFNSKSFTQVRKRSGTQRKTNLLFYVQCKNK